MPITKQSFFIRFCAPILMIFQLSSLFGQGPSSDFVNKRFLLASSSGYRDVFEIELNTPGRLKINATWTGTAKNLALILNGPGKTGYYARKDGDKPLIIDFSVSKELLAKGIKWNISIVNFSKQGDARGIIKISYPSTDKFADVTIKPNNQFTIATVSPEKPVESPKEIERTILENGTVEIRYPDGAVKIVYDCGYDLTMPDGTASSVRCAQTPPLTPPALPDDDQISDWLQWQSDALLSLISSLVNYDSIAINNFTRQEDLNSSNIYDKMYIRTNYIDRLLEHR